MKRETKIMLKFISLVALELIVMSFTLKCPYITNESIRSIALGIEATLFSVVLIEPFKRWLVK